VAGVLLPPVGILAVALDGQLLAVGSDPKPFLFLNEAGKFAQASVYPLGHMLLSLSGQSDAVFFHPAVECRLMKAETESSLSDTARLLKRSHDDSAIQVMLCLEGAAKTRDYPVRSRLAFTRQHYLDSTTHNKGGYGRVSSTMLTGKKLRRRPVSVLRLSGLPSGR